MERKHDVRRATFEDVDGLSARTAWAIIAAVTVVAGIILGVTLAMALGRP